LLWMIYAMCIAFPIISCYIYPSLSSSLDRGEKDIFCPTCGKLTDKFGNFCQWCGSQLDTIKKDE
jgi:predicted amidophosphoribosyltransferase